MYLVPLLASMYSCTVVSVVVTRVSDLGVVVRVDGAAGTRPVIGCTPSLPTQHARDWWMEAGWRPDGRLVDEWKAGWLDGCRKATRGRPVSVVRTL